MKLPWTATDWHLTTYADPRSSRWVSKLILVLRDGRWIRLELHPEELRALREMATEQLRLRRKRARRPRRIQPPTRLQRKRTAKAQKLVRVLAGSKG